MSQDENIPSNPELFFSVEETLFALQINIGRLQDIVATGRIRAFRDGESVKFLKQDIISLRESIASNSGAVNQSLNPTFPKGAQKSERESISISVFLKQTYLPYLAISFYSLLPGLISLIPLFILFIPPSIIAYFLGVKPMEIAGYIAFPFLQYISMILIAPIIFPIIFLLNIRGQGGIHAALASAVALFIATLFSPVNPWVCYAIFCFVQFASYKSLINPTHQIAYGLSIFALIIVFLF